MGAHCCLHTKFPVSHEPESPMVDVHVDKHTTPLCSGHSLRAGGSLVPISGRLGIANTRQQCTVAGREPMGYSVENNTSSTSLSL